MSELDKTTAQIAAPSCCHTTILHLTDLHFTNKTRIEDKKKRQWWSPWKLAELKKDGYLVNFESHLAKLATVDRPDLVVVTGDLVDNLRWFSWGHRKDLEKARSYLYALCATLKLEPKKSLLVIPGNHDVRRSGIFKSSWGPKNFSDVFSNWQLPRRFAELNLFVACFDSNCVNDAGGLAMGEVAVDQLISLTNKMPPKDQGLQLLALVHHHPLPVPPAEKVSKEYRTWWERRLGRIFSSPPEFMVLRNSGRFLLESFKLGFGLILHGHYHKPGYWRLEHHGDDGNKHVKEVISGASLTACDHVHAFQVVKINRLYGLKDATSYSFGVDGGNFVPHLLASNDEAYFREKAWTDPQNYLDRGFRCKCLHVDWCITLPDGDATMTQIYSGLHCEDPQATLPVITQASVVTDSMFEAWDHNNTGSYVISKVHDVSLPSQDNLLKITHKVKFTPPLGNTPVDLVCQQKLWGAMYSSVEDQRYIGDQDEIGVDFVSKHIRVKTDTLIMTLKFIFKEGCIPIPLSNVSYDVIVDGNSPDKLPVPVHGCIRPGVSVTEEARRYCDLKRLCPLSLEDRSQKKQDSEQARLLVTRPVGGLTYRLIWGLPEKEPLSPEERERLNRFRESMLQLKSPHARRLRTIAFDFLVDALNLFKITVLPILKEKYESDASRIAHLFALDESNTRLVCLAASSDPSPLRETVIPGGKDIIGTAHRNGKPTYFSRQKYLENKRMLPNLPHEIEHLAALPLHCEVNDSYPTAVLAISSKEVNSNLSAFSTHVGFEQQFMQAAWALWVKRFKSIMGLEEEDVGHA